MPFTDAAWDGGAVESSQSAADYCRCCLVDTNPPNQDKVKANCKLPVRATPNGPYNRAALRAAASRIFQMTQVPADEKRRAARRLVRLMREAGMMVGDSVRRLAGVR